MRSLLGIHDNNWCVAIVVVAVCTSPLFVFAQETATTNLESEPSASQSVTTVDALTPVENLVVLLRPLTKEELTTELTAWLELLKAKIVESGTAELHIKSLHAVAEEKSAAGTVLTEAETKELEQAKEQLVTSKTEEAAIVLQVGVVIEALKLKGGDTELAELYVAAVSDISQTTDSTAYYAAIVAEVTNWFYGEDGGKYWAKKIVFALIILFVFWMVSKIAGRSAAKVLEKHPKASQLLENFARRTTGGLVFVIGVFMSLATLGVPMGPLMAALGGGGFIVGFALQETLGNFASGLLIMVYRPFDLDDYVNVAGVEGTVQEMSLVATSLLTLDNKVLVIPNKKAWGETIVNFTGKDIRRVDMVFGIGYEDDIQQAMDVLKELASEHKLVLDEPALTVHVDSLGDSSVNIFCRPWVKTSDYWTVHWDLTHQVKVRFDAEGISIPFPQRDVHMHTVDSPVQT